MTLDLTPFRAFSVGFDDLFDELRSFKTVGYPPYNIEKMSDGIYNISMAVAGFSKDDLTISVKENVLKVKGKKESKEKDYLYKGIGERSFEQSFKLAEFTEVSEVKLEDGVLNISLIQDLPEEKKEKTIKIS